MRHEDSVTEPPQPTMTEPAQRLAPREISLLRRWSSRAAFRAVERPIREGSGRGAVLHREAGFGVRWRSPM